MIFEMDSTTFAHRLEKLVAKLRDFPGAAPSLDLFGLDVDAFRAMAPVAPPNVPYARHLLRSTSEVEVALARWTPGIACAPHDHGVSNGWIYCLSGRLRETEYAWTGDSLVEIDEHVRKAGETCAVRADEIHTCVAEGETMTLHVYFPRSESVRLFDTTGRRTLTVVGEVGAWFPVAPERISESQPWPRSR
ncbi:MAG: cysteine dioxygenase family protein [Bdellovibrionales bacterium]|nr:cysteine dioxygenase family protein [Bdellovibrionales bacterium]